MNIYVCVVMVMLIVKGYAISLEFNNKEELLKLLMTVSHDQLVYLLYALQPMSHVFICEYNNLPLAKLYSITDRKDIINYFHMCLTENISSLGFDNFLSPSAFLTVRDIIKQSQWEQKIRWVINAEKYVLINSKGSSVKKGSIVQYVNYLNKDVVEKKLLDIVEKYPQLNERNVFDVEIMGLTFFEYQSSLKYILSQSSITFLKQLYLNILEYKWKFIIDNKDVYHWKVKDYPCDKIRKIYKTDSIDDIRSWIFDEINEYDEMNLLSVDNFVKTIVKSNHTFIDYTSYVHDVINNRTKLIEMATLSEMMHRSVKKETKSFKNLKEYISCIKSSHLRKYILAQMSKYPSLTLFERFDDMIRLSSITSVSTIQKLLDNLYHIELLRWCVNLKQIELLNNNAFINNTFIDNYLDNIRFVSDTQIKNEILKIIFHMQTLFQDLDKILYFAEPTYNIYGNFQRYLTTFPPYILNTWLCKLIEYNKNRTNVALIEHNPFAYDKTTCIDKINDILIIHQELYNLTKFSSLIDVYEYETNTNEMEYCDNYYGNIFANFPAYANTKSVSTLRKWVLICEKIIRKNTYVSRLNGMRINFYKDKRDLVNLLMYFRDVDNRFSDIYFFDSLVGMNDFHYYIHGLNKNEIKIIVERFYQYYNIKIHRIKQYSNEFIGKDFMNFIYDTNNKEIDINKAKLFIFTISSIFPELSVIQITEEIINNDEYLNYTETYTSSQFETYITNKLTLLGEKDTNAITNKFLRLYNSTLPLSSRKYIPLDNLNLQSKISLIMEIFYNHQNKINVNWNIPRLLEGYEYLVYDGIAPFLLRQSSLYLERLRNNINETYLIEDILDKNAFKLLTFDEKVNYLMYIITENNSELNEINKLVKLMDYKKMSDVSEINFSNIKKSQLKMYALLTEMFVRSEMKLNEYGSIYKHLHDLSVQEIEDYIANCYNVVSKIIHTIDDFDLYSNIYDINTFDEYLNY